jgi:hypothetical protein
MHKQLRGVFAILFAVGGLLLPLQSLAAEMYQIEIIVFSRPAGGYEEHSASALGLRYPSHLETLQQAPADATSVGPYQLLPASARLLNNEETALARRGYPILFHGAWRQSVDTATRATSVLVPGGRSVGNHRELEGYVTLSAESYLHLNVNLWLSQFSAPGSGTTEVITLPTADGLTDTNAADAPTTISKLFLLQQQRKLRSGELHYFDHPRFSALVLVKPVE